MTEDDVRSALKSINEVFLLLDNLTELSYFVNALDIVSRNLQDGSLKEYWDDCDREHAYKRFCKVHNQLSMIGYFSRCSGKFLEGYEQTIRDKLEDSLIVLIEINRELSDDKSLAIPVNDASETCNNFIVDKIDSEDYYYW